MLSLSPSPALLSDSIHWYQASTPPLLWGDTPLAGNKEQLLLSIHCTCTSCTCCTHACNAVGLPVVLLQNAVLRQPATFRWNPPAPVIPTWASAVNLPEVTQCPGLKWLQQLLLWVSNFSEPFMQSFLLKFSPIQNLFLQYP
jgi:hypothetical protein